MEYCMTVSSKNSSHSDRVWSVDWSPTSDFLSSGSGDKTAIGTSTTLSFLTDGSTDWTIAFWMKLNATDPNGNNAIFCQGQGNEQGLDILFDDRNSLDTLQKIAYDGRKPGIPWREQNIDTLGYHYYMTPETAEQGISKMYKTIKEKTWTDKDYPYLPDYKVFAK